MDALRKAISILGTQADLARLLDVTPQAVTHWLNGARPIAPLKAVAIEELTKGQVTRLELRPDFPWVMNQKVA